jgi:hypothetical protein
MAVRAAHEATVPAIVSVVVHKRMFAPNGHSCYRPIDLATEEAD